MENIFQDINDFSNKNSLKRLYQSILKLNDDSERKSILELIQFFNTLLRFKSSRSVTPISEFVTVIKNSKPVLFYAAKNSIPSNSNLYMLFRIEIDLELAQKGIDEFFKVLA